MTLISVAIIIWAKGKKHLEQIHKRMCLVVTIACHLCYLNKPPAKPGLYCTKKVF